MNIRKTYSGEGVVRGNRIYASAWLWAILLVFMNFPCRAQNRLSMPDFSQGEWQMFVTVNEGPQSVLDKLENFYTSDTGLIHTFVTRLFHGRDTTYEALPYYSQLIRIVKDHEVVEYVYYRPDLGLTMRNDVIYRVDQKALKRITRNFSRLSEEHVALTDLDSARSLCSTLDTMVGVLTEFKHDPVWKRFEGRLIFQVQFPPELTVNAMNSIYSYLITEEVWMDSINTFDYLGKFQKYTTTYQRDEGFGFAYCDSLDKAREALVRHHIAACLQLDTSEFDIRYYCLKLPSADGNIEAVNYILFCNQEAGKRFNCYPLLDPYHPFDVFEITIYRAR